MCPLEIVKIVTGEKIILSDLNNLKEYFKPLVGVIDIQSIEKHFAIVTSPDKEIEFFSPRFDIYTAASDEQISLLDGYYFYVKGIDNKRYRFAFVNNG